MQVSIIIPAYNAASFLGETLESVVSQTLRDWELVVVDDGSRDGTAVLVEQWASRDGRIRLVRQANGGVATARNRGYAESDPASEFVIFLDHDDLWEPDTLQTLMETLRTRPGCVAAHGLALQVDGQGRRFGPDDPAWVRDWDRFKYVRRLGLTRVVRCTRSEPTTFDVLVYIGCICTPGLILIRRAALAQAGLFDAEVAPCDDWDLWVRLSLRGDIAFVDRILLYWRAHGSNASTNTAAMGHAVSQIRRKMFRLPELTPAQRRLAHGRYRRMFASVERHNALDSARWALRDLRRLQFKPAAGYAAGALRHYARYVGTRLLWRGALDHGPITVRLKDRVPAEGVPSH